jgi:hypothetical protein
MGVQVSFMGVGVGSAGRQAWLWPLNQSGPAVVLGCRQRFCTSEDIRPVRLLQINFGAVAHRAMWGYGVDPPADINPHLGLASRISARSDGIVADGDHHALGWCPCASAPLNRPVKRRLELAFDTGCVIRTEEVTGTLTARGYRYHPARYMKGPPQVHPRSVGGRRKLAPHRPAGSYFIRGRSLHSAAHVQTEQARAAAWRGQPKSDTPISAGFS